MNNFFSSELAQSALTVIRDVCAVKKGERVLIVSNPNKDTAAISGALFDAASEAGGIPVLIFQQEKTLLDYADKAVIAALKTEPDVFLSISANKLGKDEEAMKKPYITADGSSFDHIFDYLLDGKKTMRAAWTPGITSDMFKRAVCIDYKLLADRCAALVKRFVNASSVHVTAPAGTDIVIPVKGRRALSDDGCFTRPGTGGNIPAGEVFISPVVGFGNGTGAQGRIVYDGSITLNDRDIIIRDPIIADVSDGFVTHISAASGKPVTFESCDAGLLVNTIGASEQAALKMEAEGRLPAGMGEVYRRNARNIGELGIGLNPAATIAGNMLEDEKAFRTCHFAIGSNYDNDAPSLTHLDGVVLNPTIVIQYEDGSSYTVETAGKLADDLLEVL